MSTKIVLNTSPTLALIAALGNLELLSQIYDRVLFSDAVAQEIRQAGQQSFGVQAFEQALQLTQNFEQYSLVQPVAAWLTAA